MERGRMSLPSHGVTSKFEYRAHGPGSTEWKMLWKRRSACICGIWQYMCDYSTMEAITAMREENRNASDKEDCQTEQEQLSW